MRKQKKYLFACLPVGMVVLMFLISTLSFAQYKITFVVKQTSPLHSNNSIYVAGNFNSWNPSDKNYLLIPGKK